MVKKKARKEDRTKKARGIDLDWGETYCQCLCTLSGEVALLQEEGVFWSPQAAMRATVGFFGEEFLPERAVVSGTASGLRYQEPLGADCSLEATRG